MNKTAIKNFAIWARNKLRADITRKAGLLGINEKGINEPLQQSTVDLQFFDIGTETPYQIRDEEIKQRNELVTKIKSKGLKHAEAFDAVIEEVAYTWFNRLIAVRFMEVNDYLPGRVRVLSSENPAKAEPDFVTDPFDTDLEFTQAELDLIDDLKDHNKSDELFQFLFIKQCNKLNEILPELFEKTNDYTEILLNVSFSDKDGVVWQLVHKIDEDDFNIEKEGQVEIIGWLYQYYNTEPKDKVFGRPSGQKIRKEEVPAATQLFTPDWIVRYMVENSLGRIPLHNLKYGDWNETEKAKIDTFKSKWKYYLEEAEQSQEIIDRFRSEESNKYNHGEPPYVNTTFLDPCMGSGHILVYAFDLFMDIYTAQGYTERDAARRIVEKNLYGLEIDDRAAQLAYFAVMMKARSYDRRFLTQRIRPNLCSIQESNSLKDVDLELFGDFEPAARRFVNEYIDAKEYGSILTPHINRTEFEQVKEKYFEIEQTYYDNYFDTTKREGLHKLFPTLILQTEIMLKKYEVVCTNPPYMGGSGMSTKLSAFVKKNYPDSKSDLFSVFIEKGNNWVVRDGYNSMVTMQSWMFLSSFEKMRSNILVTKTIVDLMHMDNMVMGIAFGTAVTVFKNCRIPDYIGTYIHFKLQDIVKDEEKGNTKPKVFPNYNNRYAEVSTDYFSKIPGSPIAYWVSENVIRVYERKNTIRDIADVKHGLSTGKNDIFVRLWQEVDWTKVDTTISNRDQLSDSKAKFFPYNKGGLFRKWFGNNEYVIWYDSDGQRKMQSLSGHRHDGKERYFQEGITWSFISSSNFGVRYTNTGFVFDVAGSTMFSNHDIVLYLTGLLCSKLGQFYMSIQNPTLNFQVGNIKNIPVVIDHKEKVNDTVERNIYLAKSDWDSFESSWDFSKHPFVHWSQKLWDSTSIGATMEYYYHERPEVSCPLELCFMLWQGECNDRFNQLKSNEEELNRIFIDIYGLQDELTPEVEDKDVTVRKADLQRDMRSFVSYAVGCMFGRYSLDREGLVFAGGNFNDVYAADELFPSDTLYPSNNLMPKEPEYTGLKGKESVTPLSFKPDYDNCIPITDTPYFEDDIVGRFTEFVKVVFGEETLEANLEFIAKTLGNKGNSSREIIRNYFLNDFFKDHCKIYQKRPIYWLFDSGKQNGFKALVYMHRWNADTIGNMRIEYLHRVQRTYEKEIEREEDNIDNANSGREKAVATKRKEKLQKQLKEAKDYDVKVAHLALFRPDIDLDDGVKVNYEKVQTGQDGKRLQILAKI